jgi:hypothetical protein
LARQQAFAAEQRRRREAEQYAQARASRRINQVVVGVVMTLIVVAVCIVALTWAFKS